MGTRRRGTSLSICAVLGLAASALAWSWTAPGAPAAAGGDREMTSPSEAHPGCVTCHSDPAMRGVLPPGAPDRDRLYVPTDALAGSVHEAQGCESCHPRMSAVLHAIGSGQRTEAFGACVACHERQAGELLSGVHVADASPAPTPRLAATALGRRCVTCHGSHQVLALGGGPPPGGGGSTGLPVPVTFGAVGALLAGAAWLLAARRKAGAGRQRRRRVALGLSSR